jgi:hypothetical protein
MLLISLKNSVSNIWERFEIENTFIKWKDTKKKNKRLDKLFKWLVKEVWDKE